MTTLEFGGREIRRNELKVAGVVDAGEDEYTHHDRCYVVGQAVVTKVEYPEGSDGLGRRAVAKLEDPIVVEGDLAGDIIRANKEQATGIVELISERGEPWMLGQWFRTRADNADFVRAEVADDAGLPWILSPADEILTSVRELDRDALGGPDWVGEDSELGALEEHLEALGEILAGAVAWARRRRAEMNIAEQEAGRVHMVDGTVATPAEAADAAGEEPDVDDDWDEEEAGDDVD